MAGSQKTVHFQQKRTGRGLGGRGKSVVHFRTPFRAGQRPCPSLYLSLLLGLSLSGLPVRASQIPAEGEFLAPSTRRMAERMQKIYQETDALRGGYYFNRERSERYQQLLLTATNVADRMTLQVNFAQELLNSGKPQEALREFGNLAQFFKENRPLATSRNLALLRLSIASTYLWQGEMINCLSNHHVLSCLFPITSSAIQKEQGPTRDAIDVLTNHLNRASSDLRAVWLLNLAAMQVGDYPQAVPPRWLIDPKLFASEYDIKHFPDVAPSLGLNVDQLAGGSILEDFNSDGNLDLMISAWDLQGEPHLFRNNGDGTFTDRTRAAGLTGETGSLNIMQADYNNDGHPDVLMLRGAWLLSAGRHPNSLLRNNGDGTFTDVTEEAGLLSFRPTQTATWFDYNNDGWIDLFIGNESSPGETNPCELFRNNGDGTFTECGSAAGVAKVAFVKGVTSGDFNNDGRSDLYISIRGAANVLYRNDGPGGATKDSWKFTDVSLEAKVTEPINSFPTWFWDYDNDGWLDIFVSGYQLKSLGDIVSDYMGAAHGSATPRLYKNNQDGTFTDVTVSARLGKILYTMGCNFGDLDNDGWLDFYVGTGDPDMANLMPNRMFRNADGNSFQEVTTSGGFGQLHKGHGISFGDIDNDGDQDINSVIGGAYYGDHYFNQLFENPGHGNQWVTLKLEGVKSNRSAIGARIKVITETPRGERSIHRTVSTGGSFGANPLRQEIGLGDATSIKYVEIFWPVTGKSQRFTEMKMRQWYRIREDELQAVPVQLRTLRLTADSKKGLKNQGLRKAE